MGVYPKNVELRAFVSRDRVSSENEEVCGRAASFLCGCLVTFSLRTDQEKVTASFASTGCGYMVAVADILTEVVSRKNLSDLHGLGRPELVVEIERELNRLPAERENCAEVCFEALRNAFAALRDRRIEEFRGDEALICTCFGVSERVIDDFIDSEHDVSVESVAASCRAGNGCGSCRMLIQEMIDSANAI